MKYPRFSITALLWFTAIVAIVTALPRQRPWGVGVLSIGNGIKKTYLTREYWPLGWELFWRGAVVVGLCLIVWVVHWLAKHLGDTGQISRPENSPD